MSLRQLPNLICIARMALVVPVAWLLAQGLYVQTLWLFGVAAASDGLDGYLAKRFGWTSELGRVLDPLADNLLLVTVFIVLAVIDATPLWLAIVVVARDVVIGVGALTYKWLFGPLHGRPTVISKINTGVQLLYVLALVAHMGTGWPRDPVVITFGAAVFVTTMISGIDYVITYSRRAAVVSRARRA